MRSFLIFLGLVVFAVPALAMDQQEYNLEMQRMQLEQARIQANGMAMMGAGAVFANGMNQAFRPLPMPVMPTVQPMQPIAPPPQPLRCITTNPGAMQQTICY
jgi:hypothetical protein